MNPTDPRPKMDKKHRERGDNWTTEEKEIFMEIMKESAVIIEDKKTDTNSNKRKVAEWQKVQNKLQELTMKRRDVSQMKGFWRRMKITAKKSVSDYRRALRGTGGGPRPPTPTEEVQTIMEMCPTDFIEEKNEFDSDSIFEKQVAMKDSKVKEVIVLTAADNKFGSNLAVIEEDGLSTLLDVEEDVEVGESIVIEDVVIDDINNTNNEIITKRTNHIPTKNNKTQKKPKKDTDNANCHKAGGSHKNIILENNLQLKEKSCKLIEEEYALKITYQKRELSHQELKHKFEIDILMLEKEKKALELNILRKNNNTI